MLAQGERLASRYELACGSLGVGARSAPRLRTLRGGGRLRPAPPLCPRFARTLRAAESARVRD